MANAIDIIEDRKNRLRDRISYIIYGVPYSALKHHALRVRVDRFVSGSADKISSAIDDIKRGSGLGNTPILVHKIPGIWH